MTNIISKVSKAFGKSGEMTADKDDHKREDVDKTSKRVTELSKEPEMDTFRRNRQTGWTKTGDSTKAITKGLPTSPDVK